MKSPTVKNQKVLEHSMMSQQLWQMFSVHKQWLEIQLLFQQVGITVEEWLEWLDL